MIAKWGRTTGLACALGLAIVSAACGTSTPPLPDAHGLVVLDGGMLRGWLGSDSKRPAAVEFPAVADSAWIAASSNGRLVALSGDTGISVSDELSANTTNPLPDWRTIEITDAAGHRVPGPYSFPTWDPSGSRLAFLAVPEDGQPWLVVADVSSGGVVLSVLLQGPEQPTSPTWVGADRLSLQLWADGTSASSPRRNVLVDATSGEITAGPERGAWFSSPDGGLVLTTTLAASGPYSVQTTDRWLAGDQATMGDLAPPTEAGGYLGSAFDQTGTRVAIAWLDATSSSTQVSEHIYTAASGWNEVAATPARQQPEFAGVAWLP